MGWKQTLSGVALIIGSLIVIGGVAAAQSISPNYRVDEYYFGTGGELNACSGNYCSKQSAGELAAGRTSSANYQAQVGFNTSDTPILEVAVNGTVNFGVLDPDTTATGTANVQVRTYLSSGYDMVIAGSAPKINAHTLHTSAFPEEADPGTEQFGINLVKNTSPSVGDDPEQVPDDTFSFGLPTSNYSVGNQFMYQSGATVASSNSSSGQTNYTLSFIANMANNTTPAGKYTTDLSVVVVAKF
jgi:hypothetical protein